MPTYQVRRRRPRRHEGQGVGRGAERGRAAQPAAAAQPRGQEAQAEEELQRDRAHAAARPEAGDHALLPPDGGVRAHRHPDHRRARGRSRTARATSASSRSSREMREQIQNGVPFSDALAEHATCSRRTTSASCARPSSPASSTRRSSSSPATSSATSRRESKIKSALIYPLVDPRHVDRHRRHPRRSTCCRSSRSSSRASTPSCRCRRACCSTFSDFTQKFWFVWVALFIAFVARAGLDAQVGRRADCCATSCSCGFRSSTTSCCTRSSSASAGSSAAMVKAGVPLPEALEAAIQGTNNKVFETGLVDGARAHARGRRARASRSPTRSCSRSAATQMMRVGEDTGTLDTSSRTPREYYGRELEYKLKKLTSLFEPAVIIFMGVIVGFVAVALVSAMYGIFNQSKSASSRSDVRHVAWHRTSRMIRRDLFRIAPQPAVQTCGGAADPERTRGTIQVLIQPRSEADHKNIVEQGFTLVELLIVDRDPRHPRRDRRVRGRQPDEHGGQERLQDRGVDTFTTACKAVQGAQPRRTPRDDRLPANYAAADGRDVWRPTATLAAVARDARHRSATAAVDRRHVGGRHHDRVSDASASLRDDQLI